MKKILSLILLALLPMVTFADDAVEIDGIYYILIPKGKIAEVTSNPNGYTGAVNIPATFTYDGKEFSVTSIGNSAFEDCSSLTTVTIPSSVTSIGNSAFEDCSSLTSVTIPNSVTSIGQYAFDACSSLTSVTIGNSVSSIGEMAFANCISLTSVTIPNSVISIGRRAFRYCPSLTSVTIGNSVTSIGKEAFNDCRILTSVTIGNSVSSIGDGAFSECSGLTSITIPNSVTNIDSKAFYKCSSLTSVTIGNSVTSIGKEAFAYCSGLKKVIVSDIGAWCGIVFDGDYSSNPLLYAHHLYSDEETEITDLVIPNSVTSIGRAAFYCCSGLTSITIPNSVTSIGDGAFANCTSLTSVTIPNSVTSIGRVAFDGCSSLTSISIPNNVTSIGNSTFYGCSSLTSVTIPNSVTSIGNGAFSECSGLTSVTIGNSVSSIGERAFGNCSGLTSITIGNSVTSIGERAFADCPELTDVYCYAEEVPNTKSDAFEGSYIEYATLHVPESAIEQYKATEPWSQFGTKKTTNGDTPEPPKPEICATPTISYANGKLTFTSDTEGAECVATVSDTDIKTHYGNEISLTATYTITVYATKAGYENSDVATGTLCWIDVAPQTEGIVNEDAVMEVKAMPVLIQSQGGTISIQGAAEGTPIAVYDAEGKQYGSTIAEKDRATITTSLRPGSIAVVKIGEKSIKVLIK